MKNIRSVFLMLPVLAALLVSGCKTPPAPRPENTETLVLQAADLKVSLNYISKTELEKLYGKNDILGQKNPYVDFPGRISKKRFVVFQMTAETAESTVNFTLDDIVLTIHSKTGKALSRPYLRNIWGGFTDEYSLDTMDRIMKKTILPRKFTVSPEKPVSGYLVFGDNFPEEGGQARMEFQVSTPQGDTGTLELPLTFGPGGGVSDKKENSGIFSN